MNLARRAAAVAIAALISFPVNATEFAPLAHAGADCANRGEAHIEQHGGLAADSAWHVAHGQLPTCDPRKDDKQHCDKEEHDAHMCDDHASEHGHHHGRGDEPREPHSSHEHADHRDHWGIHCTWHGCG